MRMRALYLYLSLFIWVSILIFSLTVFNLNVTGLGITLTFLTIIILPGWLLSRILNLNLTSPAIKSLYLIGLGFGFYFLINFLGIILGLSLLQVMWMTGLLTIGLFVIGLIKDFKGEFQIDLEAFKKKDPADWIFKGIILITSIIVLIVIDAQSDRLIGDGWFHLAILNKIVSGPNLTPHNLWVVKTESLNPVYAFPIWHILVAEISKFLNISIFTALRQVLPGLAIITLIIWYSFLQIIFGKKYLVGVIYFIFLIIFLNNQTFYYFIALASPDSFNRLLLLPLILGISANFIFKEKIKIAPVVIISFLAVFLGLIHFTQFIYLFFILIMIAILGLIYRFKKEFWLKLGLLLGGILIMIVPYGLIQSSSIKAFLSGNALAYQGNAIIFKKYLGANIFYRYAIICLPILFLFVRKRVQVIMIIAITLGSLLIYWQFLGLGQIFYRYFGQIFVERSLANIPHFIMLGLAFYLMLWAFNLLLVKVFKSFLWIADVLLIALICFFPIFKTVIINIVDGWLFTESKFFNGPSFWLALGLIILLVIGISIFYRQKTLDFPEPKNKLNFVLLVIFLIISLALPYFGNVQKVLAKNPNGTIFTNRAQNYASDINYLGSEKTLEFLKTKSDKVYVTDAVTLSQMVLLYSNNYAAEYPYGITDFGVSHSIYDPNLSQNERLNLLNTLKIDLIIVRSKEELPIFSDVTKFEPVFENHYLYNNKPRDLYIFEYLK